MTVPHRSSPPGTRRRRATTAVAAAAVATAMLGLGAGTASAAPVSITDAAFEWSVSSEVQSSNPAPGTCPYLSAGQSDGTQATYQTAVGNVTILKNGAAPTWSTKCEGATTNSIGQKIVWTGGTGTADPATGEATISFTGQASVNFYSGMVPFTIVDPVLTVGADGDGQIVASIVGYASSIDNPGVKTPLPPVDGVVIADLTGVNVTGTGFSVTPDYAGVQFDAPTGTTPQNRSTTGWGSWPVSFVDYHIASGLSSYWYTSGGAADPRKPPAPITFSYSDLGGGGGGDPTPPGDDQQVISVVVPEAAGEFTWSITGDGVVDLGATTNQGTYLRAAGQIDPITVNDGRTGAPSWDISGQVTDFNNGVDGKYLGWTPKVVTPGGGALAGSVVTPGLTSGDGLTASSLLASAPSGHASGTATIGADLELQLPVETPAGAYTAALTITALS